MNQSSEPCAIYIDDVFIHPCYLFLYPIYVPTRFKLNLYLNSITYNLFFMVVLLRM